MKIRALVSFSGALSMRQGEVREVTDETGKALVKAGHAEKVSESAMASENSEDELAEKADEPKKEEIAPVQSKKAKKAEKNAD